MQESGPQATDGGTAGVVARPPLLFLAALLLGLVLERLLPWPLRLPGGDQVHWAVVGAFVFGGLSIAVAAIRNFLRAGTPVPTNRPTRALVTGGVYRWTRNPIYLGLFLVYGGIGIAVSSYWVFVLLVPLAVLLRYGVVAREETYLERRFGDPYRDYKARVRRWL